MVVVSANITDILNVRKQFIVVAFNKLFPSKNPKSPDSQCHLREFGLFYLGELTWKRS